MLNAEFGFFYWLSPKDDLSVFSSQVLVGRSQVAVGSFQLAVLSSQFIIFSLHLPFSRSERRGSQWCYCCQFVRWAVSSWQSLLSLRVSPPTEAHSGVCLGEAK